MTETAEIISRLRCQHIDVARRAADIIESLVASEAEERKLLNEVLELQAALLAKLRPDAAEHHKKYCNKRAV